MGELTELVGYEAMRDVCDQAIQEALRQLGNTEIVPVLLSMDVTGYRGNGEVCPIANYLRKTLPMLDEERIDVFVQPAEVRYRIRTYAARYRLVPNPQSIGQFVIDFDKGLWPELVTSRP